MSVEIMQGERKPSKGGFFHLFDWNGKSRKKLFANNSELPEGSKAGKEYADNVVKPRLHLGELDDRRAILSNRGSSDFSCASSVTSNDEYGTKAPGVVARLMGLDSLPTSNVAELSCSPNFHSGLLRASPYDRSIPNLGSEYNTMDDLNIPNKQDKYSWHSVESRLHKVQSRPIERFQTETLPPKSAKSIPVTHHKLLSPIKNPRFIPTKNVAYIMEAAAKIIEASPNAPSNGKVPTIGSSSVPLRIRDLKQKTEAAHTASRPQRSNELCAARNTKKQLSDKSLTGSEGLSSSKVSAYSEKGTSNCLRNKGKSVPFAPQVKANAQRRDGSTSRSKSSPKQKEPNEVKTNHLHMTQQGAQKAMQKRTSESKTNNVLQQNNHKQNSLPNRDSSTSKSSVSNRDSSTSKSSVSNKQSRKTQSSSGYVGPNRTVNKVVVKPEAMPKKAGLVVTDSEMEKTKNVSQKKQSVSGNLRIDRSVSHNVSLERDEQFRKNNVVVDGSMNTSMDNKKNGLDVVSFTFSSPIKGASTSKSSTFFLGLSATGGDALGVLLERKLRELTNKVESSHCNVIREETSVSSSSSLPKSLPMVNVASTSPAAGDKTLQIVQDKEKSDPVGFFDSILVEGTRLTMNQKWQQSEEMEVYSSSSNYSETGKELDFLHSSPVSTLESSFASGSCSNINGSNHCFTTESGEVEVEAELSDSASSISTVDVVRKYTSRTFPTMSKESRDWELDYMRDILGNTELISEDFALGHTSKVINPNLFERLEHHEGMERNEEEFSKLRRKILFDCVCECLNSRCGQIFVRNCKAWPKLSTLFRRKEWLAEELYKEISGWKSMGDLMVDELVDKDMSTKYGRWLDFEIEAFEEGVEIENGILSSLVEELVSDLMPL